MEAYKIGYSYNIANGEFIGAETVYLEKATGTYPCAANVTFKKPPELRDHEAAIWNKNKRDWDVVPDWRGCPWFNDDGTFGGIIEELGKQDVITEEPPEVEIQESLTWKNGGWQKKQKEGWIKDKAAGTWREMTQVERIYAGLEEIPEGCKVSGDRIVAKTPDELYDDMDISTEEYNQMQIELREAEYKRTTDKLGLMVLRGEATMEEWQAAIAEVKAKYPKKKELV